jgi:hypothetical protein
MWDDFELDGFSTYSIFDQVFPDEDTGYPGGLSKGAVQWIVGCWENKSYSVDEMSTQFGVDAVDVEKAIRQYIEEYFYNGEWHD